MLDRDNVIAKLQEIVDDKWMQNKADFYVLVCAEAIALLKEHGHGETFIVIDNKTGKEADMYNIALHEDWAKNLCYCDMEGWAIEEDGTLLLVDECGRHAYADRERFKVVWDAWQGESYQIGGRRA